MNPPVFSQGLTRAASAVILPRLLVIIRMAIRIYTSFYRMVPRWKDFRLWISLWQPKVLPRSTHLSQKRYWLESALYGHQLRSSDARYDGWKIQDPPSSPLITYYVPRLLPAYRSPKISGIDSAPYRLPARIFCKWHHMVFHGPLHPTLSQAQKLMKYYSNRDLKEMYRISRLLPDEEVSRGSAKSTGRYKEMWTKWLNTKGPDNVIVFE